MFYILAFALHPLYDRLAKRFRNAKCQHFPFLNLEVIANPKLLPIADTANVIFVIAIIRINDYNGISRTTLNTVNKNFKFGTFRFSLAPRKAKQISTFCPLKLLRWKVKRHKTLQRVLRFLGLRLLSFRYICQLFSNLHWKTGDGRGEASNDFFFVGEC